MSQDTVYLGIYDHEYGVDADLYFDEDNAWHTLATVAFQNLDDIEKGDVGEVNAKVIQEMVEAYKKGDYKQVCALYNRNAGVEACLDVRAVSLSNAQKPCGKLADEQLANILETWVPQDDEDEA